MCGGDYCITTDIKAGADTHFLPGPVGVELVPHLLLGECLGREAGDGLGAGRSEGANTHRSVLDTEEPGRGVLRLVVGGVTRLVHRVGDHAGVGRDGERPGHRDMVSCWREIILYYVSLFLKTVSSTGDLARSKL